jgi:hypothetical protein
VRVDWVVFDLGETRPHAEWPEAARADLRLTSLAELPAALDDLRGS